MREQLYQTERQMLVEKRTIRHIPPSGISSGERTILVERLVDALWTFTPRLGINLGPRPITTITGSPLQPTPVILGSLTAFLYQLLACYLALGLGAALTRAFFLYTQRNFGEASPDYHIILDETYNSDDDAATFID